MPNWCENTLIVKGERTEIERFCIDGVLDGRWKLSAYIPTPKELETNVRRDSETLAALSRKYGHDNWYEWRLANYGCKWDCDTNVENIRINEDGSLSIWFESPWSPPIEFLKQIQTMYPELDFALLYMEGGCFFAGLAKTERDSDGNPYIEDVCGEPYYEDENGNVLDTESEGFDWETFEKEHEVYMCNPFEDMMEDWNDGQR